MKKVGLFSLLAVSACALAGCGKGLSTEEAVKFASDNFAKGEAAIKEDVEVKTVAKVSKATGFFADDLGMKKDSKEDTEKTTVLAVSTEEIAVIGASGYKFSTFAGKLYADLDLTLEDLMDELGLESVPKDALKGEGSESYVWNKEGFPVSYETKYDVEINTKILGKEVKGAFVASMKVTYSY